MNHSSDLKPRIFPILGVGADAEIDRAQTITPNVTLNSEKITEIGRKNAVGYIKKSPTVSYSLSALESGAIEFYQKLVNTNLKGIVGQDAIDLDDFKSAYFDICGYVTDDDKSFVGTFHYPTLRTAGFSISVADPQANVERSFDLIGESAIMWQEDNKYFIGNEKTIGSAGDTTIVFGSGVDFEQVPVADPDTGKYILRAVHVDDSLGTSKEMVEGTDFSYDNGTATMTLILAVEASDTVKIWYTSSDAPDVQFTPNDSDATAITGDSVDIFLTVGDPSGSESRIARVQSVTVDVSFDREDYYELGNENIVQRGINAKTVTVTLGRLLEDFTIEEILRDKAGAGYGKIDVEEFVDNATVVVKIYEDSSKTTLKYGFMIKNLSVSDLNNSINTEAHTSQENVLVGEEMVISADNSKIGNIS